MLNLQHSIFMMKKRDKKKRIEILKNKYLLTFLGLAVWITFFDKNDIVSQVRLTRKIRQLEEEKKYFVGEIEKNRSDLMELKTNPKNLEKYAREKYLMKKENEDIFVIVNPNKK